MTNEIISWLQTPCVILCVIMPTSASINLCPFADITGFFFSFSTPTSSPPTTPFIHSCVFSPSLPRLFFTIVTHTTEDPHRPIMLLFLLASLESHHCLSLLLVLLLSPQLSFLSCCLTCLSLSLSVCLSGCFCPSFPVACMGEAWQNINSFTGSRTC